MNQGYYMERIWSHFRTEYLAYLDARKRNCCMTFINYKQGKFSMAEEILMDLGVEKKGIVKEKEKLKKKRDKR